MSVRSGNLAVVNAFLEKGVDQHKENRWGETALHVASQEGHANVVKILLECGSSCDKQDKDGRTALHVASQEGHANVVKILLERGSDFYKRDECGYTALYHAVKYFHAEVVRELVGFIVSLEKENVQQKTFWDGFKKWMGLGFFLGQQNDSHKPLLDFQKSLLDSIFLSFDKDGCIRFCIFACQSVDSDIFDMIIPFYEDVDLKNANSFWTPLEIALEKNFVYGVKELLRRGEDRYTVERNSKGFQLGDSL